MGGIPAGGAKLGGDDWWLMSLIKLFWFELHLDTTCSWAVDMLGKLPRTQSRGMYQKGPNYKSAVV
ncbi:hypothetical protein ABBQ38_014560 [Trebouxia sp. C0009 RCD-2024]